MLDFYEFVSDHPGFKRFEVDQLLFTTYDCPIEAAPLDYWTQKNYFTFMISGMVTWKTPVQKITVGAKDIVFVKKGVHRVYRSSDEDFCAVLIFMPDEFIKSVIGKHRIYLKDAPPMETNAVIPLEKDDMLSVYTASLIQYFSKSTAPARSLLKVKFEELILHLLTSPGNSKITAYFKELCHTRKRSIKEVMESHFAFNLPLMEFARLSERSLATFKRDFAKIYQTTPGKWLKDRRLDYGKFLLETTDHNVSQITLECGFENVPHFIKSFREKYKRPPLQYKKLFLTNSDVAQS